MAISSNLSRLMPLVAWTREPKRTPPARILSVRGVRVVWILVLLMLGGVGACESEDPTRPEPDPMSFAFDFDAGGHGWLADFVDFPLDQEAEVGFVSDRRPLRAPLDENRSALYHRGLNLSDDLFMYHKRRVHGLEPGATYRVHFRAEFATTVATDCISGLALFLKAGAVVDEPQRVIGNADGWVRLSADKGIQTDIGDDVILLGEMRSTTPGCPEDELGLGELESDDALTVTADEDGAVWLFFGEESVFEIAHEVYYTFVQAVFEPVP